MREPGFPLPGSPITPTLEEIMDACMLISEESSGKTTVQFLEATKPLNVLAMIHRPVGGRVIYCAHLAQPRKFYTDNQENF